MGSDGEDLIARRRRRTSSSQGWQQRIALPTIVAGSRELVRELRAAESGDLTNSFIGGIASGAFLGRLQGGQFGAVRYSIIFAFAGTALDYGANQLKSYLESSQDSLSSEPSVQQSGEKKDKWLRWPEWAPIQLFDEEAAAKEAQEKQFFAQQIAMAKLKEERSLEK
ncbi:uncharacterized protein LOC18438217 isoform X3 [Amborella trichopoda]|uniref:uncharacterized protein LOC18438217 isoform X3 n=1 Tax=Amborella trichopoda TaxID=13333 RepID=UPI0009BD3708|nr:uncharacterized protein LOC18438217 isoform X3 [Amborella trichopoda]|eukprot:XP_020525485.1 uncharacterized protein LOC18438217 isoform X3 [Amborella trichopoda]